MSRQSEWQAAVKKRRDRAEEESRHRAKSFAMAEVPASKLVDSDEWRFFQQMLQASVDDAKAELETIVPKLLASDTMSHESLLILKMRGVELQQHITSLETAIELPRRIREDAKAARKWLEDQNVGA